MAYMLIILSVLLGSFSTVCQKNYTIKTTGVKTALNLYMFIAHPIAAIYFLCLAKGFVPLNVPTFIFSFFYAVVCIASVILSMLSFQKISLVYISVFGGAGGVILPFLFEAIFRNESFSAFQIISVIMRLLAVLIPLFTIRKSTAGLRNGLILCILLFINGGIATILPKLFTAHPETLGNNTFCFWTNVVIIPIITVYILKTDGIKQLARDVVKIKGMGILYILLGTALGNISSLIKLNTLNFISATVNSVLSSSLSMIFTLLVSRFIYKEEISKQMLISVAFSILTVIFGVLG